MYVIEINMGSCAVEEDQCAVMIGYDVRFLDSIAFSRRVIVDMIQQTNDDGEVVKTEERIEISEIYEHCKCKRKRLCAENI